MLIGIGFIKVGIILKAKLFDNKDSDNPEIGKQLI
jgi:hypothetical protein